MIFSREKTYPIIFHFDRRGIAFVVSQCSKIFTSDTRKIPKKYENNQGQTRITKNRTARPMIN